MRSPSVRLALPCLVLATVLAAPLARGEESLLTPPPPAPHSPSLLEWLQRALAPGAAPGEASRVTPRGVAIPPKAAPGAPSGLPAGASEETVAQPLVAPDFQERSLDGEVPPQVPVGGAEAVAPQLRKERLGYAFGHPRILAQQTLFGLAHGVTLLSRACALLPEQAVAAREAYRSWEEKNRLRLALAEDELARYYFTPPHDQVRRLDLVQALQLRPDLGMATEGPELLAACASLPEALAKPRYDLETQWQLKGDVERLRRATETRELVGRCRQQLAPVGAKELEAVFRDWERRNSPAEAVAYRRLAAEMAATVDPRHPEQPVDGDAQMKLWQDQLRRAVARRLEVAGGETLCSPLAADLPGPGYALEHAFDVE